MMWFLIQIFKTIFNLDYCLTHSSKLVVMLIIEPEIRFKLNADEKQKSVIFFRLIKAISQVHKKGCKSGSLILKQFVSTPIH